MLFEGCLKDVLRLLECCFEVVLSVVLSVFWRLFEGCFEVVKLL